MLGFGGSKTRGTGPIGLALTGSEVRLAQRLPAGGYLLEGEALSRDVDVTEPGYYTEVSRAIGTALRRTPFTGKRVVCALPADTLIYKTFRMPPMPDEEMLQAVKWEAVNRFQLPEEHAVQIYRAGEVNQSGEAREEVVMLAVNPDEINNFARAIQHVGLIPAAIDATGAGFARLFGQEGQASMVIHLTDQVAEIIGIRDHSVIFDKLVHLTPMQNQIDSKSLVSELGLCLRYLSVTFGVHQPDAIYVCGACDTPSLVADLVQSLNTPLQTAQDALSQRGVMCSMDEAGLWALAIGLAERSLKGSAQRGAA